MMINVMRLTKACAKGAMLIALSVTAEASGERRVTTTKGNVNEKVGVKVPANLSVPSEWQQLLDPTTDAFWLEGNHKPDAGFLLWAKNPTVENAKLYLIRMNAKRDRMHLMQAQQEQANLELIKFGIVADDYGFLAKGKDRKTEAAAPQFESDVQIFFLFSPTCPHCKRQAQNLAGQKNVIPVQIGGRELVQFEGLPPSTWAGKEDIERYAKDGVVPVLLVYHSKSNNMATVKGVRTIKEINQIVDQVKKEGKKP